MTQPLSDLESSLPIVMPSIHPPPITFERQDGDGQPADVLRENDRRYHDLLDALPAAVYTTVLSLSPVLHELCTNAAKYGALSNDTGRVGVDWGLTDRNGISWPRLRWQETGGPRVRPPWRTGFGSRLITRGVAHELSAEVRLEFPATGVVCEIDAPIM